MAIVNGSLQLGYKNSAWFAANPTLILKEGQAVFLEQTGTYKLGDGTSQLSALTFLGGANSSVDGLQSGGTITVGTFGGSGTNNDIRVSAASWLINPTIYSTAINTDFLDIALSSSGLQRYIGLYGTTSNTITKVEGSEAALATYPTTPANSIVIGYVLVNDASASTTPDLSGYLLKLDKATQSTNTTGTNDTTYVTPLANAVKENTANKSSSYTASSTITYANTKALVDGLDTKAFAETKKTNNLVSQEHFYSDIFVNSVSENFTCVANSLRGNPFMVKKSQTLNALSIRISSGATAGTTGRLAVYSNNNGALGLKLWEGTDFSLVTSATIVVTGIGLSLSAGVYWAVFNSSASSGLIRTSTNGINPNIIGVLMNSASPLGLNGISYAGITYGSAFPSDLTATSPTGYTTGTSCPAIYQGYL